MLRIALVSALGLSLGLAAAGSYAIAQAPAASPAAASEAGNYTLDPRHSVVIARVGHMHTSHSVFRFDEMKGTLKWNPAAPETSSVDITVNPKSISSHVAGFGAELGGDKFLNVAKFPEARFVSRSIKVTGPDKGVITGDLTLMGVTKSINVDAQMIGAGKNPKGVSVIGFYGMTNFKRSDFGAAVGGPIGDPLYLQIDLEFNKAS